MTKGMYAKIKVPPRLQNRLVDDCEFVTSMGKVTILNFCYWFVCLFLFLFFGFFLFLFFYFFIFYFYVCVE